MFCVLGGCIIVSGLLALGCLCALTIIVPVEATVSTRNRVANEKHEHGRTAKSIGGRTKTSRYDIAIADEASQSTCSGD